MNYRVWYAILCYWLAGLLAGPAVAQLMAPVDVVRVEVKHIGPPATSDDFIRAQIRAEPGMPYTPSASDDDIQNLYETGLFTNIRITQEETPEGIVLTYIVQGHPRLTDISIEGNDRLKTRKLMKEVTSKVGEPLDERKLFGDKRKLQELYEKKGYPETRVEYIANVDEAAGLGTVRFEITESPRIKIKRVTFKGAEAFPEKKLRKLLQTKSHFWLSWLTQRGRFKPDVLEEDRLKLEAHYLENGYLDFTIRDVELISPATNSLIVQFDLMEGSQYEVGSVTVRGPELYPTNTITELLRQGPGSTFTPGGLQQDVQAVEDFYGAKGYADVKAGTPNLRIRRIPNIERGTIDLEYDIVEGQKSYVEKIKIVGNYKTRDKVLRRELAISPGEVLDTVGVRRSRERLEGLQFFSKVDIRTEDTTIRNRKDLVVAVDEMNTGSMSLGAAFNSIESLAAIFEVTQGNFDIARPPRFQGGGQQLRLKLQLGTTFQDYRLQFIEPWFLGRKLRFSSDLFYRELGFQSLQSLYDESQAGARISFTKPLWSELVTGSLGLSIRDVGIINVNPDAPESILKEEGHEVLTEVWTSVAYDTRRGARLFNQGQRTELLASLTGGPLAGGKDFYRLKAKTAWYFRGLSKSHLLEIVGNLGVVESFGATDDVPFYERFYLGGLRDVRGYEYRAVGPREPINNTSAFEPVGGKTTWFASAEYSIPIIEQLRIAAFYDIGMVYPDAYSFTPAEGTGQYNDNWGFGFRINLPIGPLRLDYAIPITHGIYSNGDGRFQIGIGYNREF